MSTPLEQRLKMAFDDVSGAVEANPDLFWRVQQTVADARHRRVFRLRLAAATAVFVLLNTALAAGLASLDPGRSVMPWWVIELITNIVLVTLAVALGPFIKRFGRAYAADVFRDTPRTGKSYLVLTDIAYYLIFAAFILFTVNLVPPEGWEDSVAEQLKEELARVGGILLLMGVLHAANVVALPIIGRLLSRRDRTNGTALTPGTFVVRIEPGEPGDVP